MKIGTRLPLRGSTRTAARRLVGRCLLFSSLGLGTLTLAACSGDLAEARRAQEEMEPQLDHAALNPAHLTARTVSESELLGMPRSISVVGRHVVVSDMAADRAFHVFDRDSGAHLNSFGRRGNGPGEFMTYAVISRVPGGMDVVDALDPTKAQLTRLELPGGGITQVSQRDFRQLPASGFPYDLVMLDQDRAAGLGLFPEGRLGVFDLTAGTGRYTGQLPQVDGQHNGILQQAWMGRMATNPAGTRIAVVTMNAGQLEIYDAAGDLLSRTDGPFPFDPDYRVGRQGDFERGIRHRTGYSSVAATEDRIYALFAGRAEAHFRGWKLSHGEFIHVFDWSGELDRVFSLDREVLRIALDQDASAIFAITDTPTPAVLRFPIP
jgi:hypothetical protein